MTLAVEIFLDFVILTYFLLMVIHLLHKSHATMFL